MLVVIGLANIAAGFARSVLKPLVTGGCIIPCDVDSVPMVEWSANPKLPELVGW